MTFNWHIVKAPLYVVGYLVAHELVHLMEGNHTPHFWNILPVQIPNYQKAKDWLKMHGDLLAVNF
ncbi:M48 family metallopeptidase [Hymenobacter sp. BT728]|nr:M48 family metallopeptidase [Hymenobacter pini]